MKSLNLFRLPAVAVAAIAVATMVLISTIVSITGCENNVGDETVELIESMTTEIRAQFAPDKRVALFQPIVKIDAGTVVISGYTNIAEAKKALIDSLNTKGIQFTDSLELLPSSTLNGKIFGVVNNSVANIRSEPKHSAELATQALLGTPLAVLRQAGEWYLVQTPDKYISWVDHGGLVLQTAGEFDAWKGADKVIFTEVAGFSYSGESEASIVVSDLVMGSVLEKTGEGKNFYSVRYPDGRMAFVKKTEAQKMETWLSEATPSAENLTNVAFQLIGAPYLWGGTSTKGMDCSGFTKTIYLMNGLIIPRDASQQVFAGKTVDTAEGWDQLQIGDLLFFGSQASEEKKERVVHVGMWIGQNKFIHASGQVRVSSVDPADHQYDEFNVKRFLRARRYASNFEGAIVDLKSTEIF